MIFFCSTLKFVESFDLYFLSLTCKLYILSIFVSDIYIFLQEMKSGENMTSFPRSMTTNDWEAAATMLSIQTTPNFNGHSPKNLLDNNGALSPVCSSKRAKFMTIEEEKIHENDHQVDASTNDELQRQNSTVTGNLL